MQTYIGNSFGFVPKVYSTCILCHKLENRLSAQQMYLAVRMFL